MTRKIYKSALGKTVDLGSLILQNEGTRAVGNMNVNARGDLLDGNNRVIDQKNRQVQRQYQRTTNVSNSAPVQTSTRAARQAVSETIDNPIEDTNFFEDPTVDTTIEATLENIDNIDPVTAPDPLPDNTYGPTGEGGLAAAIARSRLIKQEKEKTLREKQQAQGIRKI
jgi:hypothetical protein